MFRAALLSGWHVHAYQYADEVNKIEDSELACVWDEDEARGKELAGKFNKPFVSDLDTVLADKTIDGVIISTATTQHKEIIIKAANAGKHTFSEKVLGLNVAECREIKAALDKNNVSFCIALFQRGLKHNLFAKKMIDSGELGKITYLRIRNAHGGIVFGWLPEHFFNNEETGGGAMMDLGSHPMYLIRWLLGRPSDVVSMFTESAGKGTDDNCVSVFSYEDGAIAVSETGFVSPYSPFVLELYGTKGSVMINGTDVKMKIGDNDWEDVDLSEIEPLKIPMEQWVSGKIEYDYDSAESLSEMMEFAYESQKTGSKINFN